MDNKEVPKEVIGVLAAINRSKGHSIVIDPDGKVWTLEEEVIKVPTSIKMGKGKRKLTIPQTIKSLRKKEMLGNIYTDLDLLPLPSTSFVSGLVGKQNFFEFGSRKGQTEGIRSTNFLRDAQLSIWQAAVFVHPEAEIKQVDTRYGRYRIFYFSKDEVTILATMNYEVREIIYKDGSDIMDLSHEIKDVAVKEVQQYKLGDGSKAKVKITRKKSK
jgi:intein/homing endonuclease